MKIEDTREDRTATIYEIMPGCVFRWEGGLFLATDATYDNERTRLCVDIEEGRTTKFVAGTSVLLVDAKAVIR